MLISLIEKIRKKKKKKKLDAFLAGLHEDEYGRI